MRKHTGLALSLCGALLAFGCGNDSDGFNDVVLLPTVTATTSTTTSTTSTSSSSTSSATTSTTSTTQAVKVTYVRLGAAAGGTGTETAPFSRIQDAVNAAGENETIFVYANAGGSSVVEPGTIKLKPGQSLIGEAAGLSTKTIAAGARPVLGGLVAMNDNTTVSGFEIRSAAGGGVTGAASNNVTISNNLFTNVVGTAIAVDFCTGNVVVKGNTINQTVAAPVTLRYAIVFGNDTSNYGKQLQARQISSDTTVTIQGNTIAAGGFVQRGIYVDNGTYATVPASSMLVDGNVVSGFTQAGIDVDTYNESGGVNDVIITNNKVWLASSIGVRVSQENRGVVTIRGNQLTLLSNTAMQLNLSGSDPITVESNAFTTVEADADADPTNNPVAATVNGTAIAFQTIAAATANMTANTFNQQATVATINSGGSTYGASAAGGGAIRFNRNTVTTTNNQTCQWTYDVFNTASNARSQRVVLVGNTAPKMGVSVNANNRMAVFGKFVGNTLSSLLLSNSNTVALNFDVENLGGTDPTQTASFGSGLNSTNTLGTPVTGSGGPFTSSPVTAGDQ